MNQPNPKIKYSVIIPTYNNLENLKECLKSIEKNTDFSSEDTEIIVVANGCTDTTHDHVRSYGKEFRLYWFREPVGFPKAVNMGVSKANGDKIIILNDDVVILDSGSSSTWIRILEEPFKRDYRTGISGPMVAKHKVLDVNYAMFFCVMTYRSLFLALGGLDEDFSPGFCEDVDFCIRAYDLGYKIVQVPEKQSPKYTPTHMFGEFPIYHKGNKTFSRWIPEDVSKIMTKHESLLLQKHRNLTTRKRLNLGCGNWIMPNCINVDIDSEFADVEADVRSLPFDSLSIDEIHATHLIEHLDPREIMAMFKEWNRVLKPGGKLFIEMPDILQICQAFPYASKQERYILLNCIYGSTLPQTPHKFGWYDEILVDHLYGAGFDSFQRKDPVYVYHWGRNFRIECKKAKDFSQIEPSDGEIISDKCNDEFPDGWFPRDDINAYRIALSMLPQNAIIAELGVWKGRSLCSVADIIKNKNLRVYAIDTFAGSEGEPFFQGWTKEMFDSVYKEFVSNVTKFGLSSYITLMQMDSIDASKVFRDKFFDFVFIDTGHSMKEVKRTILYWYPKVKGGGGLAGHDFLSDPVKNAVLEELGSHVLVNGNVWLSRKPFLYDGFIFYNELDVLEIRLNELYDVVDYFVLVEATRTFSDKDKPLYFETNKKRFEKFLDKVIHIVVDNMPSGPDPWVRERHQRSCISRGWQNCSDGDLVCVSDVDEIPKASILRNYRLKDGFSTLEQSLYYYFLNCKELGTWRWFKILPYSKAKDMTPEQIRYTESENIILNAGWHFSFLGDVNHIASKIESYAHQEYNLPQFKDPNYILSCLEKGQDVFKRKDIAFQFVEIDSSYPEFVTKNLAKFLEKKLVRIHKP